MPAGSDSGAARRRRTALWLRRAALGGVALGAGLAVGTNVPGDVLALYGLGVALVLGSIVVASARLALEPRKRSSKRH